MAPFAKIYSYPNNWRVNRAQVVAALNGLEVVLDPAFQMGVTNKEPAFLSKFPMGKVPALECEDGFCLAEGAAIASFLASAGPRADQLLGSDVKTRARVAEWSAFAESELAFNSMTPALMVLLKLVPYDAARYDWHASAILRALKRLDGAVQGGKKFLVGEAISLADIMVAGPLLPALSFLVDKEMRDQVPEATRYVLGLAELPEFKNVYGEVKLCETRLRG